MLENMRLSGELSRSEISLVDRLVEIDGLGGFRVEISQKGLDEAEISILRDGSNSYNCFDLLAGKHPIFKKIEMIYLFTSRRAVHLRGTVSGFGRMPHFCKSCTPKTAATKKSTCFGK